MADSTKYGRVRHYGYTPSAYTPVFSDLDRHLPQPIAGGVFSPLKRRYPKPIAVPSIHKVKNNDLSTDKSKSSTTKSTATNTTPVDLGSAEGNVSPEQRTMSVSRGKALYSTTGHVQENSKRPAKRRYHSAATPGLQDEVPVETKRAKRNYSTSAANPARLLNFSPFNEEPPVFTLDTLTTEIEEECQKYVQTTKTLEKKLKLKSFLERGLSSIFPGCSLHLCGSSSNGFGGNSSDADFCFILNHLKQANNRKEALPVLRRMQRLLDNDPTYSFLSECSVIPASVPILKFMDTVSGCECDININNTVGVRNTHLLRAYCGVDYRVKPLVVLVKKWAKKHDINDASQGTLSSYALTLMVIHYLQGVCKPPVVPVLQRKYPKVFKYYGDVSELSAQDPCKHIESNESENKQSIGELFVGFFKYYALDFRWNQDYISIVMGGAFPRHSSFRKPICIEEPFDGNNVAKAVCTLDKFNKIHMKFRLAWHTLKISPSLESIKVT